MTTDRNFRNVNWRGEFPIDKYEHFSFPTLPGTVVVVQAYCKTLFW